MINPVFVTVAVVALGLASAAAIYRIAKGPSLLDRVLATDVLLSIVITALCIDMAVHRHLNNLILVISLTVVVSATAFPSPSMKKQSSARICRMVAKSSSGSPFCPVRRTARR